MGMQCHVDLADLVHRGIKVELCSEKGELRAIVYFDSQMMNFPYGETLSFDCRTINHSLVLDLCKHNIPFTCS